MTPGGLRGSDVDAGDDEDATMEAEKRGYKVLDVIDATEMGGCPIVVIEND